MNIEDEFWDEIGIVAAKVGDYDRAIGLTMRWLRFNQQKFKKKRKVTYDEFKDAGFPEALMPTFAKRDGDFVVAVGAKKHFSWLLTKAESGSLGGTASAESRKTKSGSSIPEGARNTPKQRRSTSKPPKLTEASLSLSSSSSDSNSAVVEGETPAAPDGQTPPGEEFPIVGELAGNADREFVLAQVPFKVQSGWYAEFTAASLKKTIDAGVTHYLAKFKTEDPITIQNWNELMPAWIKREKSTLIQRRKP